MTHVQNKWAEQISGADSRVVVLREKRCSVFSSCRAPHANKTWRMFILFLVGICPTDLARFVRGYRSAYSTFLLMKLWTSRTKAFNFHPSGVVNVCFVGSSQVTVCFSCRCVFWARPWSYWHKSGRPIHRDPGQCWLRIKFGRVLMRVDTVLV